MTPKTEVSEQYYRSKLSTYNLTVFDLGKKQGFCYMWHEALGQRGSAEIGSCILEFIKENIMRHSVKEFSFFSDNCAGQNRNRNIVTLYLYCAVNFNIKITHNFLEKGHTQNEGDSIHSTIERASRNIDIFVPSQWYTLARTACKKKPYVIKEMGTFWNLHHLRESTLNNMNTITTGENVKWTSVRVIMVEPSTPNIVNIKYQYDQEFLQIDVKSQRRRTLLNLKDFQMVPAYSEELPIYTKKFKHLQTSCKELVIPHQYHNFYASLKHSIKNKGEED